MRLLRPLLLFLLLATLYFTAIFALGPRGSYPDWFRGGANLLFGSMGSNRIAKFEPFDDPRGTHDTRMSVGLRNSGYPKSLGLNSVRQGYTPAALLAALVRSRISGGSSITSLTRAAKKRSWNVSGKWRWISRARASVKAR